MRRPASLSLRVTILFGFISAMVLSGFGFLIVQSIDHHFIAEDTSEMTLIADTVERSLSTRSYITKKLPLEQHLTDTLVGHHGAILYVAEDNGKVVYSSHDLPDLSSLTKQRVKSSSGDTVRQWKAGQHAYRVLIRHIDLTGSRPPGAYIIWVAVSMDSHLRFFEKFNRTLLAMIVSGTLMTGLMGWFAVRQGHAPLRHIVTQIHTISANELNTRLEPGNFPQELTELAVSFNEMLERMDKSFQKLSNYAADIAHELRTPVTSMLTQTQVSLSKSRTVDEYREVLYSNIEEYEHMSQMINDMLFLAKVDNGLYEPGTDIIHLNKEVQNLFEYYEAWTEDSNIELELTGQASVVGDRPMLRRAMVNLLSNAIKNTPSGNTVSVQIRSQDDDTVSISFINQGNPIPEEVIPRLFDRFYRGDNMLRGQDEGSGLGLAIAKSIIDLHHGEITVTSNEANTCFSIILPKQTIHPVA